MTGAFTTKQVENILSEMRTDNTKSTHFATRGVCFTYDAVHDEFNAYSCNIWLARSPHIHYIVTYAFRKVSR